VPNAYQNPEARPKNLGAAKIAGNYRSKSNNEVIYKDHLNTKKSFIKGFGQAKLG